MGQYQQPWLDLKGCTLELAQRNSQASVPFMQSSLGYGLLWNNPAIGEASFAKNQTEWRARVTGEMDYWITAADTVADITRQYVKATGTPPRPGVYQRAVAVQITLPHPAGGAGGCAGVSPP